MKYLRHYITERKWTNDGITYYIPDGENDYEKNVFYTNNNRVFKNRIIYYNTKTNQAMVEIILPEWYYHNNKEKGVIVKLYNIVSQLSFVGKDGIRYKKSNSGWSDIMSQKLKSLGNSSDILDVSKLDDVRADLEIIIDSKELGLL